MQAAILSTAYLPNLSWFYYFLNSSDTVIEKHEHYIKQTYRNRCEIASANGKLCLTIPLQKLSIKEVISEKKINYTEKWQMKHWRAITSAYKNSPYFEFFEDEFKPFYTEEYEMLFDFNIQLIRSILKIMRTNTPLKFTSEYIKNPVQSDLRNQINLTDGVPFSRPPYHQVFNNKFEFIPNLSIIDLLFNQGLSTLAYLKSEK